MYFIRLLIIYCTQRALKYDNMLKLLMEQNKLEIIYAIGTMVYNKNKWLNRVKWLDKKFGK